MIIWMGHIDKPLNVGYPMLKKINIVWKQTLNVGYLRVLPFSPWVLDQMEPFFIRILGRRLKNPARINLTLHSLDWFSREIETGNHGFPHERWGVPVIFSLNQSSDWPQAFEGCVSEDGSIFNSMTGTMGRVSDGNHMDKTCSRRPRFGHGHPNLHRFAPWSEKKPGEKSRVLPGFPVVVYCEKQHLRCWITIIIMYVFVFPQDLWYAPRTIQHFPHGKPSSLTRKPELWK